MFFNWWSVLESSDLWVEVIISLFGMRMGTGIITTFLLSHDESRVRKCPVVPLSATANSSTLCTR